MATGVARQGPDTRADIAFPSTAKGHSRKAANTGDFLPGRNGLAPDLPIGTLAA